MAEQSPEQRQAQKDRLRQRMEGAALRGGGSAFAANHQVSSGLSAEEAKKAAERAQAFVPKTAAAAKGIETVEEPTEANEAETAAPGGKPASEEEVRSAKQLVELMRSVTDLKGDKFVDPLMSPGLRQDIEASLEDIDVSDLIFRGYVTQTITLFDGNLVVVLKSLRGSQYAAVDRWVTECMNLPSVSNGLKARMRTMLCTALSISTINGVPPDGEHLEGFGGDNDETVFAKDFSAFSKRFQQRLTWFLSQAPGIMDLLSLNVTWFEQRIRRTLGSAAYMKQEIKKS